MMFMESNELFRSTREHSVNVLVAEFNELRQNTTVHIDAKSLSYCRYIENPAMVLSDRGILEVLAEISKESKVGVLNMMVSSQIYNPTDCINNFDTLVLASNLFEAISSPAVFKFFFDVAGKNRLVYSKRVTFFRDKEMNMLPREDYYTADICTVVVPQDKDMFYLKSQFKGMLKLMLINEIETLVVGVKGISQIAAQALIDVLSEYHFIKRVVFTECTEEFKKEFEKGYMKV